MAIDLDRLRGEVAVEVDANDVSASDFYSALDAFLSLVRELTRHVNGTLPQDAWLLNVQEGSQVVSLGPNPTKLPGSMGVEIISLMDRGLTALENKAVQPEGFSEAALESARTLARLGPGRGSKRPQLEIRILTKQKRRSLTPSLSRHVSELLDWKYEDFGTVEGTLEAVSAHGGYEFRIYEPMWLRPVRCNFEEDLLPRALEYFRKRVEVSGLIRYTQDGFPTSVSVTQLDPLPDQADLPNFREIRGILSRPDAPEAG